MYQSPLTRDCKQHNNSNWTIVEKFQSRFADCGQCIHVAVMDYEIYCPILRLLLSLLGPFWFIQSVFNAFVIDFSTNNIY